MRRTVVHNRAIVVFVAAALLVMLVAGNLLQPAKYEAASPAAVQISQGNVGGPAAAEGPLPGGGGHGVRIDPKSFPLMPDDDTRTATAGTQPAPRGPVIPREALAALKLRAERGDFQGGRGAEVQVDLGVDGPAGSVRVNTPLLFNGWRAFSQFGPITPTNSNPPDPHIAVGPEDMAVAVNRAFRGYDRIGNMLFNSTLENWFANQLPANQLGIHVGDPRVLYDTISNRFVMTAQANRDSDHLSRLLVSVSTTNLAQASWCNYFFNASPNDEWPDWLKAGVGGNNVVLTANMFSFPTSSPVFQTARIYVFYKTDLYDQSCPNNVPHSDFINFVHNNGTLADSIQPSLQYQNAPLNHLVASHSQGGSGLTGWVVDTQLSSPSVTRVWRASTRSYSVPPDAQQPGTNTRIDTSDNRLMDAIIPSNGRLWTTHTIACVLENDPTTRSCVRWYEVDVGAGVVLQQSAKGATGAFNYYPAISASGSGTAMIVYNRSSTTIFPGIRFTGRKSTDPLNTLQPSQLMHAGVGCFVSDSPTRWGDYGGIAIDPNNFARWWAHHEWASGDDPNCGNNVWRTWVAQLGIN